jgi:hypothetical protein
MRFTVDLDPMTIANLPAEVKVQIAKQIDKRIAVEHNAIEHADMMLEARRTGLTAWAETARDLHKLVW